MQFFKSNKQKRDEAFMRVNPFDKVPDDLKGISIKQISELLSRYGPESPDHFRLVHELDRRIVQPQVRAKYIAIVVGLFGILLGWSLSHWYPSEPATTLNIIFNYFKKQDEGGSNNKGKDNIDSKILPTPSPISKPVQPINQTNRQADNYQHKQQGNNSQSK